MIPIFTLVFVIAISLLIMRIAAIALAHTGLSRESAGFQSCSAFTGVGFTSKESEKIVNHPVRRRIIYAVMLCGNVGIVTAMASLFLGFLGNKDNSGLLIYKLLVLFGGMGLMWYLALSHWFDRLLSRIIEKALKRYTNLVVADYVSLFHLSGDYRIVEMRMPPGHWANGKTLKDLGARAEGVLVLGIERADGRFLGAPKGFTQIKEEDNLVIYGRRDALERFESREPGVAGEVAHRQAVQVQTKIIEKEKTEDKVDV